MQKTSKIIPIKTIKFNKDNKGLKCSKEKNINSIKKIENLSKDKENLSDLLNKETLKVENLIKENNNLKIKNKQRQIK